MRASDRWEGALRILAVLLVLAAIPAAVWAGQIRYTEALAQARADRAAATAVSATVAAPPVSLNRGQLISSATWQAQVRWQRAGHPGTAFVPVPADARPGDRIPLQVGRDGRPIPDISAADVALGRAVDRAAEILAVTAAAVIALLLCGGRVLGRVRRADWDRDWRALSRADSRG